MRILQHFFPTFKPAVGHSRTFLLQAYKQKVLSLILAYIPPKEFNSDCKESGDEAMEAAPNEVMESGNVSLAGINPNNPNITIDIILKLIYESHPKLCLPKTMNKKSAIV